VRALIDGERLQNEKDQLQSLALYFAPRICDGAIAPKSVKSRAERLACMWQAMSLSPSAKQHIGEFSRLAKLMLTVVSGSVADERVFSALEVMKGARRNRLNTHLECCVLLKAQSLLTLQTFPFDKALKCWHDKAVRCRYHATWICP
jgi:hypothetical protein